MPYLMDEQGYFFLPGAHRRHDHLRRLQHRRAEVEGALLAHPAVAECGVVGSPDRGARHRRQGIRRAETRPPRGADIARQLQDYVEKQHRARTSIARGGVRRRLAAHRDRQSCQRFKLGNDDADPATAGLGEAEGLLQRDFLPGPAGFHRRPDRLERPGRMARSIVCRQFRQALKNILDILARLAAGPSTSCG